MRALGWGLPAVAGLAILAGSAPALALDLTAGSGAAQSCAASGSTVSLNVAAIAYAEPMPVLAITDYGDGRYDPSSGNNIAVGIGYSELSGSIGGFCAGVLYRTEYYAAATKDLLDILIGNRYGHTFEAGRSYVLSMSEQSFKADGLRLGKTLRFALTEQWTATLGLAASYLKASEGAEQSIDGAVAATSSTYAVGTGTWVRTETDINYSTFNPFVAPATSRGDGFTSDLELILASRSGATLDFIAMDALGRIYWRGVPHSIRNLNDETIAYNANFDRDAFITGIDSRVSFTQDIPRKLHLAVSIPMVAAWKALLEDDEVNGYHFPSVGAVVGTDTRAAELHYDLRTRAVELGARAHGIALSLTTNDTQIDRATALGLMFSLHHSW